MGDPQRFDDLVQSLGVQGYDVMPSAYGYVVMSRTDPSDVTYARHLDDLAEIAELKRWQAQHTIRRQQGQ